MPTKREMVPLIYGVLVIESPAKLSFEIEPQARNSSQGWDGISMSFLQFAVPAGVGWLSPLRGALASDFRRDQPDKHR
ncbi:hypothetical protein EMCG_06217 [[Emmonsia] crescens]|uniref:Uncharacterized protein n=1 Tax=[Emmonsia] crescens TaxID=73230 RepID=A0A0G2IBR6_9EURO|nr:hypothetical protein EMCG_06217 [Emmonsia crescens UAMH 3008]